MDQSVAMEEEEVDLSDVPASPIPFIWPADSILKPEHFTFDWQRCLKCKKDLGYAMPMNRIPKGKYLFCPPKEGEEVSECARAPVLQCCFCEMHYVKDNESLANLAKRPGNIAYIGQSEIYRFMCHHCEKAQKEGEMGLEETREMMGKFREERARANMNPAEQSIANLANKGTGRMGTGTKPEQFVSGLISNFAPRKRPRASFEEGHGFETERA